MFRSFKGRGLMSDCQRNLLPDGCALAFAADKSALGSNFFHAAICCKGLDGAFASGRW